MEWCRTTSVPPQRLESVTDSIDEIMQPVLMPTYQNKVFVRLLPGHDSCGSSLLDGHAVATYEHMQSSTKRVILVRTRGWKSTVLPLAPFTLSLDSS